MFWKEESKANSGLHLGTRRVRMSLDQVEEKHIKYVLDNLKWDKRKACEILGISKPTLYSKLQKYNIQQEQ